MSFRIPEPLEHQHFFHTFAFINSHWRYSSLETALQAQSKIQAHTWFSLLDLTRPAV